MDTSLQTLPLIFSTTVCLLSSPSNSINFKRRYIYIYIYRPASNTNRLHRTRKHLLKTTTNPPHTISHLICTLHKPYCFVSPIFHHMGIYSCISLGFCHISLEDFESNSIKCTDFHLVMHDANGATCTWALSACEDFCPRNKSK